MDGPSRSPEIGQAFYGSFSGHHDYRVLAASPDVSDREQSEIEDASNLGGTALTGSPTGFVWAAYDLDRQSGRRAFSRTIFLGRSARGNDYLAHVLLLGPEARELLRGDLFLLADLGLFSDEKPATGKPLSKLALDPEGIERYSCRLLGAGADLGQPRLAAVLRALFFQVYVALPEADGDQAEAVCRAVLAVLPPEDRERLSFCSRFSLPRAESFHLALYHPDDRELAQAHLRADLGEPLSDGSPGDLFETWIGEVAQGVYPLYGLSLRDRPDEAAARAAAFREWAEAAVDEKGTASSESMEDWRLEDLVREPRNQVLEPVQRLKVAAAIREVLNRVKAVLSRRRPLSFLVEACTELRDPDHPHRRPPERFLGSGGNPLEQVTARIALALFVPVPPRLDGVYGPDGALTGPAEVAEWIVDLYVTNRDACMDLLTAWLIRWRVVKGGPELLAEIGRIITAARPEDGEELGRIVLDVLAGVAPPQSASADRSAWFLGLLREVRPCLGILFPPADAAALVVEEQLLSLLASEETEELAPVLVERHAEAIFSWLERRRTGGTLVQETTLLPFLHRCRDGLLERELGGLGWDVQEQPSRWDLAGELAVQAAALVRTSRSRALVEDLAWLLWAASRVISKHGNLPSEKAYRQMEAALNALLQLLPDGLTDVVLRAVYRLVRFGRGFQPRISAGQLARVRERAWEDAQLASPDDEAFFYVLMRVAYLDRVLFEEIGDSSDGHL
jgi:hypothetical protein